MIIGVVSGFAIIFLSIGTENFGLFVNPGGAGIVLGGTISALLASYPLKVTKQAPKQVVLALKGVLPDPFAYIEKIVECAEVARKQGMLALESLADQQDDEFMRTGIFLLLDALDASKVRAIMESEMYYVDERHSEGISFFRKGADYAPAFGLLGTIIGLIIMLGNLDLDAADGAAALTAGMAIALITTFYGSIFANLVMLPTAGRLQAIHEREMLCKSIIVEGILSIQAGENPKFVREKLTAFLPNRERQPV